MACTILGQLQEGGASLPLYAFQVPAGFPSPAADHIEKHLSLDELFEIRAPLPREDRRRQHGRSGDFQRRFGDRRPQPRC